VWISSWRTRRCTFFYGSANVEKKKRRKRKSDVAEEVEQPLIVSDRLFALGSEDGSISVYSLSLGTVTQRFTGQHSYPVEAFTFNARGNRGISIAGDDLAVEWDVETGRAIRTWRLESKGTMKQVAWSHDESMIITAGHTVLLWNDEGKLLKRFPGHASEVRRVVFGDGIAVSIAEEDRAINVWNLDIDGPTSASVLICEANPMEISLKNARLLAALEDGSVSLWEDASERTKKMRVCDARLEFHSGQDKIPILTATFVDSDPIQVLTARGNLVKPIFEQIVCCISLESNQA
jgi:U3 small nucleolar RNA-associated protein 5